MVQQAYFCHLTHQVVCYKNNIGVILLNMGGYIKKTIEHVIGCPWMVIG